MPEPRQIYLIHFFPIRNLGIKDIQTFFAHKEELEIMNNPLRYWVAINGPTIFLDL